MKIELIIALGQLLSGVAAFLIAPSIIEIFSRFFPSLQIICVNMYDKFNDTSRCKIELLIQKCYPLGEVLSIFSNSSGGIFYNVQEVRFFDQKSRLENETTSLILDIGNMRPGTRIIVYADVPWGEIDCFHRGRKTKVLNMTVNSEREFRSRQVLFAKARIIVLLGVAFIYVSAMLIRIAYLGIVND